MNGTQHETHGRTDRLQRRAAVLDDPSFERYRSPTARQRLSIVTLGILGLEAVVIALAGLEVMPIWAFIAAMVVIIVAFVIGFGMLKASTRGMEELPEDVLDERHAQIRGRVYSGAYRLVSRMAFALFALVLLTIALGWTVPMFLALAISVVAIQLVVVAPTLVAALQHDA